MYGVLATYFSCVMIRLMLVLAPVACILAPIAISEIMRKASKSIRIWLTEGFEDSRAAIMEADSKTELKDGSSESAPVSKKKDKKSKEPVAKADPKKKKKSILPVDTAIVIIIFLISTMQGYVYHSTMLASEAYSSPSIILSGRQNDGTRYIIDDYREAYYWIKQNTPKDSKIMSWWDYGY